MSFGATSMRIVQTKNSLLALRNLSFRKANYIFYRRLTNLMACCELHNWMYFIGHHSERHAQSGDCYFANGTAFRKFMLNRSAISNVLDGVKVWIAGHHSFHISKVMFAYKFSGQRFLAVPEKVYWFIDAFSWVFLWLSLSKNSTVVFAGIAIHSTACKL